MLCRNDIAFIRFYLRLSVAKNAFDLIGVNRRPSAVKRIFLKPPIKADSSPHDKAMLCRNDIAFIRFYLRLSVAKNAFDLIGVYRRPSAVKRIF
jgi:hypothetical protein